MPLPSEILNQAEINSAVWQKLKKHIENRITLLRSSNDKLHLSKKETAVIRGQIVELKILLKRVEPKKEKTRG